MTNEFSVYASLLSAEPTETDSIAEWLADREAEKEMMNTKDISLDGRTLIRAEPTPEENVEAKDVVVFFCEYLKEHTRDWDDDKWIVLFCILNMLRVGGEKVRPFFNKGHDTINRYCNEMRTELLHSLREEFDDKAIGMALNGPVQTVLADKMKQMPCFAELKNLVKENPRNIGK